MVTDALGLEQGHIHVQATGADGGIHRVVHDFGRES